MLVKTRLDSPSGPKLRRKNSAEPTMTFHSKAATDEVYSMFNQPAKRHREDSEDEDEDYTSAGESTGTGRISATTSEVGDDTFASTGNDTTGDENTRTGSQPDSVSPWSEFTASKHVPKVRPRPRSHLSEELTSNLSSSQNQTQSGPVSGFDTQAIAAIAGQRVDDLNTQVIAAMAGDFGEEEEEQNNGEEELKTPVSPSPKHVEIPNKPKYIPLPPIDYEPTPMRPWRDPAELAQNRLPFMTPIVEKTESSLAPSTIFHQDRHSGAKTPSRSNSLQAPTTADNSPSKIGLDKILLNSPSRASPSPNKRKYDHANPFDQEILTSSPRKLKLNFDISKPASPDEETQLTTNPPPPTFIKPSLPAKAHTAIKAPLKDPIIHNAQCNPVDGSLRAQILSSIHPPLSSYPGYHDTSTQDYAKYPQLCAYAKKIGSQKPKSSPRKSQASDNKTLTQATPPLLDFPNSSRIYAIKRELGKGAFAPVYLAESQPKEDDSISPSSPPPNRHALEAIKTESPPSAWEFHIITLLHLRLGAACSRARASILRAHECHLYRDECYLVLEYRPQGTLLDLVNAVKDENRCAGKGTDATGLDEPLAMFLAVELLRTVEECHRVGVLHGDLKADNCLVRFDGGVLEEPYRADGGGGWGGKGLTLIDFGRGIDVRAFRPDVRFIADWAAGPQDCAEMREARPWTWQIDYFGLAGVVHSMLFGRYIVTEPVQGQGWGLGEMRKWRLKEGMKRYWAQEVWGEVFEVLVNPGAVGELPVTEELGRVREGMEAWLKGEGERKGLRGCVRRAEGLVGGRGRR